MEKPHWFICAEAFDVSEFLKDSDVEIFDEHKEDPDIGRRIVDEGRRVITI